MASIVVFTEIQMTEDQGRALVEKLGTTVTTALNIAPNLRDVIINVVPKAFRIQRDFGHLAVYCYTAPGKPIEAKRELVRAVQECCSEFFAPNEVRTCVIIKEHADENVGVAGVLRWDAKRQQK